MVGGQKKRLFIVELRFVASFFFFAWLGKKSVNWNPHIDAHFFLHDYVVKLPHVCGKRLFGT
jgi:hypothetical protein